MFNLRLKYSDLEPSGFVSFVLVLILPIRNAQANLVSSTRSAVASLFVIDFK
jgi:hypothetical protein